MSQTGALKVKDRRGYSFSLKTLKEKIIGGLAAVKERCGNGSDSHTFLNDPTVAGTARQKTSENGDYISQLDNPFLPIKLYANSRLGGGSIVLL